MFLSKIFQITLKTDLITQGYKSRVDADPLPFTQNGHWTEDGGWADRRGCEEAEDAGKQGPYASPN